MKEMVVVVTLVMIRDGLRWESGLGLDFSQGVSCVREARSRWIDLLF